MTYHYAIYVGPVLMDRTITRGMAARRAKRWTNAVVKAEEFVKGGSI